MTAPRSLSLIEAAALLRVHKNTLAVRARARAIPGAICKQREEENMRLTNYMRDAFVSAAMDDVPAEDFEEQARALLVKAAVSCLPPKVRALYDDPATRDFVCRTQLPYGFNYTYVPGLGTLPAGTREKYDGLKEKQKEQEASRRELTAQLHGVAYSARTRKALVALLPEFEKYLPADDSAACKTLPAIANVMADFAKAGWPKDSAANAPVVEEAA